MGKGEKSRRSAEGARLKQRGDFSGGIPQAGNAQQSGGSLRLAASGHSIYAAISARAGDHKAEGMHRTNGQGLKAAGWAA